MKTNPILTALAGVIAMPVLLTNCSMEGRVIESQTFQVGPRICVQDRIVVSESRVYETRVISRQVR